MKKIIIVLVFIFLISCSGNSDNVLEIEEPSNNLTLLISKIEVFNDLSNLESTIFFTYNNGNYLSKTENISIPYNNKTTIHYIYENGKLVKSISPDESSSELYTHEYIYSNELLIYSTETNFGGLIVNYSYLYNADGYLEKKKSDYNGNNVTEYFYSNNNSVTKTIYSRNNYELIIFYEYDNKINYFASLFPETYSKHSGGGTGNVTKESHSNGDVYTNEYIYNDIGYPLEIIEKYNGVIGSTLKIHYE